jgi:hypothetical protein
MRWPFTSRRAVLSKQAIELIQGFDGRIRALEEAVPALQLAHERLRGRFYATRPHENGSQPLSKAQILANYHAKKGA